MTGGAPQVVAEVLRVWRVLVTAIGQLAGKAHEGDVYVVDELDSMGS